MEFYHCAKTKREEKLQRRNLNRLEKKEERLLAKPEQSSVLRDLTAPMTERLYEKIPQRAKQAADYSAEKSAQALEKAFEKSFDVVLEKGSGFIGRFCGEKKKLEQYQSFAQKPLSSWELYRLGCAAAVQASANMVFSSVQGGVMGVFGIGLPDVPIFLGAVFKTLFELSLRFGYPYDLPQEQIYQMLLICAAVGSEQERRRSALDADKVAQEIRRGSSVSIDREQAKKRAAKALCSAAMSGKIVQGVPIVGVYGGFRNGVLLKKIGSVAAVKYQQRMLRER